MPEMMNRFTLGIFQLIVLLPMVRCGVDQDRREAGSLALRFHHLVDGEPLVTDEIRYENGAGNAYGISEIQWFVSDLTLHRSDGSTMMLDSGAFAHYVDTDLPETHVWKIGQEIPSGTYDGISVTFGIKGQKNKPYMYTDSPESEMIWPINLGGDQGGYHYMKLNGFWISEDGERTPFNFHLGVGQLLDGSGKVTSFVQNWFETKLPGSAFTISDGEQVVIDVAMNIEEWFDNPHQYDHDIHGGKIMQDQEAMRMGAENGAQGVFTVLAVEHLEDTAAL